MTSLGLTVPDPVPYVFYFVHKKILYQTCTLVWYNIIVVPNFHLLFNAFWDTISNVLLFPQTKSCTKLGKITGNKYMYTYKININLNKNIHMTVYVYKLNMYT